MLLFWYGGKEGWFKSTFNIQNTSPNIAVQPSQQTIYSTCSQVCSNQGFSKYYTFIDSCNPGETKAIYGYPGQQPLLTYCCYNEESSSQTCVDSDGDDRNAVGHVNYTGETYYDRCLEVGQGVTEYICQNGVATPKNWACDYGEICMQTRSGGHCIPAPHTWNPGDVVFSGGGSGSIVGSEVQLNSINLNDYGITTDGNCRLGAKITTSWAYATGTPTCTGIMGMEGLKWEFYDSNGLEYSRIDAFPTPPYMVNLHPEEHILEWDGQTNWVGRLSKTLSLPACEINYDYHIEIYVYDCL